MSTGLYEPLEPSKNIWSRQGAAGYSTNAKLLTHPPAAYPGALREPSIQAPVAFASQIEGKTTTAASDSIDRC